MDILVTGAGGFSGSNIVAHLIAQGHNVVAVVGHNRDRLDALVPTHQRLTVVAGDLTSPLPLPVRIDGIVHAAARSPSPGVTASAIVSDNIMATARLFDYATAAGAHTLIYFSSLSVYGTITTPVVDETNAIINPDVYGVTKYLGEMMLRELPLRSLSIRLPGVLGPNSVRNWLTGVLADAQAGRDIVCYNPQASFNNAIHINSLCDFVGRLLNDTNWSASCAVTVGAQGQMSIERAIKTIVRAVGSQSSIVINNTKRSSFTISNEAAQRCGYRPMDMESMLLLFARENQR